MTDTLSLAQARALWFHKQALDGAAKAPLAKLLGNSGWLRTLAGADIYIAARARKPGMKRADLDAIVAKGELRVVPAARGCIYAVPGAIVGDLMALNAASWRAQTTKELGKIGKTMKVVEGMAPAVLDALAAAPLDTNAVRKALPAGAIPSFGDAGKKFGLSSPLPLVLRLLELDGRIERTLDGGLATDRYLWRRVATKPVVHGDVAPHLAKVIDAFLAYAAPVTLAQISKWVGVPQRDVKPALEAIGAVAVTVEGMGEAWLRDGDLAAAKTAPAPSGVQLLAFEDNYLVLHGSLAVVADPRHHGIRVDVWGGNKPTPIGDADHELSRSIIIDGLLAGFWEVDPRTGGAVWHTFDPAPKALASKLDAATADVAKFLLDDVGTPKVFSLDTLDDVQARADRIVELDTGKPAKRAIAAKVVRKR
jgi:hypothetical protein